MNYRAIIAVLFGLFIIWTGLARSVDAETFKPNAFFFCFATGGMAVLAGYFYQARQQVTGLVLSIVSSSIVFLFYTYCFIFRAESDTTTRVALAIVASLSQLIVSTFPNPPVVKKSKKNGKGKKE